MAIARVCHRARASPPDAGARSYVRRRPTRAAGPTGAKGPRPAPRLQGQGEGGVTADGPGALPAVGHGLSSGDGCATLDICSNACGFLNRSTSLDTTLGAATAGSAPQAFLAPEGHRREGTVPQATASLASLGLLLLPPLQPGSRGRTRLLAPRCACCSSSGRSCRSHHGKAGPSCWSGSCRAQREEGELACMSAFPQMSSN